MSEGKDALAGQCLLIIPVALNELRATEAETDIAKIRVKIASVENTLKELLDVARNSANDNHRLGL
jgi:hypothetical protein